MKFSWKKEFRSYYDNITKQSHDFFFPLNNLTPQAFATSNVPSVIVIGFVKLDPLFGDDFVPEGSTACLVYDDSLEIRIYLLEVMLVIQSALGGYYKVECRS